MKVDAKTMICHEHDVEGCVICMVDDFHMWLAARNEWRRSYKQAWREMPIWEKFDLGGEA